MGKLFIVPTPVGNLGDITYRAIEVLKGCDYILCEDTRRTSILLNHYNLNKTLRSFHKFNEHKVLNGIIKELISGKILALVSDAGTPGLADPGFLIVRECLNNNIALECLPGPTSFIPALIQSGFPTDCFTFEGFLPVKKGRKKKLDELKDEKRTMVFFESPYRLIKTLEQFSSLFGPERLISVSRELTKIYEETFRGTLQEALNHYSEKTVKGEIIIIVSGVQ